jgi:hypothetical protein
MLGKKEQLTDYGLPDREDGMNWMNEISKIAWNPYGVHKYANPEPFPTANAPVHPFIHFRRNRP